MPERRSQRDASFAGDCELDNADCTLVIYYAAEASAKVGKIITDARYDGKGTLAMRLAKDHSAFLCELVDKRLIICYYKHNKSMLWRTEYGIRILDFDGDFCRCSAALCRLDGIILKSI